MVTKTVFPTTTVGIGRKDFSQSVEQAVEPLVRSYQNDFHFQANILAVDPGETRFQDVPIPVRNIIFVYEWYASVPDNLTVIGLDIYTVDAAGADVYLVGSIGLQGVEIHISKGLTFLNLMKVAVTNNGGAPQDFNFHCHGVYTSEEQYYLTVGVNP